MGPDMVVYCFDVLRASLMDMPPPRLPRFRTRGHHPLFVTFEKDEAPPRHEHVGAASASRDRCSLEPERTRYYRLESDAGASVHTTGAAAVCAPVVTETRP